METSEKIPVFIKTERRKTVCLCHRDNKGCHSKECQPDFVKREIFEGWQRTMRRNKYGT